MRYINLRFTYLFTGDDAGQVLAHDEDEGLNSLLVYSIHDTNMQQTTVVSINSTSGHVTADVAFDRESRDLYEFVVTAADRGQPVSRSSSVLVRLEILDENDERPTFAYEVYTFGTYENQPSGTEVGTVAAVDRDLAPYNEVEYRLQDDGNGTFEIGRRTGRITTTQPLDRENESEYHLMVVASQHGAEVDSMARVKVVVADRNDNRPRFVFPAVANDSMLVATCGAVPVARIIAQDRDIGANAALRYRLLSNWPVEYQPFSVNPVSGVVSARRQLTEVVEYPLHVQVRDAGSPPLLADTWLTLVVNCSRPRPPHDDVTSGRRQSHTLGRMLVVVVMATIASALFLICILTATVVLRHCVTPTTRADNLRTDSKPEPNHVTTSDRDELRLKIARDATASRDYRQSWYPPRYNSMLPARRCVAGATSVGRVQPMTAGLPCHVTQVPVTSSVSDDVRHCLFYGVDIKPAVCHSVRTTVAVY